MFADHNDDKQQGRIAQSTEEIKAKAKQDVTAPTDYYKMMFQLKAFLALFKIIFGEESIVAEKVKDFINLIKKNSIYYKSCQCHNEFFPTKVTWMVCCRFQLFISKCQQAEARNKVDDSILNFSPERRDIMMRCFTAIYPHHSK